MGRMRGFENSHGEYRRKGPGRMREVEVEELAEIDGMTAEDKARERMGEDKGQGRAREAHC